MHESVSRVRRLAIGVGAALVILMGSWILVAWARPHARAKAEAPPPAISVTFGPSEIWNPGPGAIQALHQCGSVSFTCVQQVLQQDGASDDAIAFYRLTGWFLGDIQEGDGVQPGTVFNPWRANENNQPALLGGVPAVVYPEQEAQLLNLAGTVQRDPGYAALQSDHPAIMFWGSSPALAGTDTSPSGGPRFLFDYRLLDGCHACAILGLVRVAFDFDADGTFEGARFLTLMPAGQ